MNPIRLLIVEDDPVLLQRLKKLYRDVFTFLGYDDVTIVEAADAQEAKSVAKGAAKNPYDLVSLDIHLGNADVTGLDVLAAFKRFKSAWMVAILTGVETDASLDGKVGKEAAEKIRKQLRRDAYARFWPERLVVIEKPDLSLSEEYLRNRLEQIARLYGEIGRQRYIFRPIEADGLERRPAKKGEKREFLHTKTLHWQIRFNCGDIRTLPDRAGFKTIHKLLSLSPDESLSPEAALVIEPEKEKALQGQGKAIHVGNNSFGTYFGALGIPWDSLSAQEQERLIAVTLKSKFRDFVELRGYQDSDDLSADESDRLDRINAELGILVPVAESFYQRRKLAAESGSEYEDSADASFQAALLKGEIHIGGANYDSRPGRWGVDSREAQNFRARKKRVVDYLRENGFADLAEHLEGYVQSTGANWSYNPPTRIEWTTE